MNIIETNLDFEELSHPRGATNKIIIHHADMFGSVEEIHKLHKNQGWSGIGYHFYIRQDGNVYRGRPENRIGAHCLNSNSDSIGICFEGRYDNIATMPNIQLESGKELVKYLRDKYPQAKIYKHSDLFATACPGRYFPFDELTTSTTEKISSVNDILWELMHNHVITDAEKWERKMNDDKDVYWLCYKAANKLRGTL